MERKFSFLAAVDYSAPSDYSSYGTVIKADDSAHYLVRMQKINWEINPFTFHEFVI